MSACKHMVSGSLSLPSRGAFHLSLTVLYSIGHMVVFSLMRWSSHSSVRIPRVPTYSGYSLAHKPFNYGTFTLFHVSFQISSSNLNFSSRSPLPHTYYYIWFGLFRFRSPLLSESLMYFLFLRLMRCFSSPGSLQYTMYSCKDTYSSSKWVSSFGNLRINTYLQFPVAYRSLSRPSSALSAKASSIRSL